MKNEDNILEEAQNEFIGQWGVLGNQWGINRTMAQIHAYMMTSVDPVSRDELMEELSISRGNAHSNLKELLQWKLIRSVPIKGERKEYFEAEKDVWNIFRIVVKQRKEREIDPAAEVLSSCAKKTAGLKSPKAVQFNQQIEALSDFVAVAQTFLDQADSKKSSFLYSLVNKTKGSKRGGSK